MGSTKHDSFVLLVGGCKALRGAKMGGDTVSAFRRRQVCGGRGGLSRVGSH
jgi:hypothetical protein